jgi:hypothetical protein
MTVTADRTPAEVLLDLDARGIVIDMASDRLRLRPTPLLSREVIDQAQACRLGLMSLLADPRRRWREQAATLIAAYPREPQEDLLHVFDEREAIASMDGCLDDHEAGQLAYDTLCNHLREID